MAKLPSENEVQLAFDEVIGMLPQNAMEKYEAQIDKAVKSGLTFKQVATVLNELGIEVKGKDVKKFYEKRYPAPEKKSASVQK